MPGRVSGKERDGVEIALRKDYGHLNLSEEAHNVLLDWHYKMGCDMNLMDESEIVNTNKKISVLPEKKTKIKNRKSLKSRSKIYTGQ